MHNYLYLILDIGTLSVPFLASFFSIRPFRKTWNALFPAIFIVAAGFIAWDAWFTAKAVWGFNAYYLLGISICQLPIEEWLFFFVVPYATVFSYHAAKVLAPKHWFRKWPQWISLALVLLSISMILINPNRIYTQITFSLLLISIALTQWILRNKFLGHFYFTYLFILIPFFAMNGALTGSFTPEPVVWYNPQEFMGLRMGTIPFEDTFYGLLLNLLVISIYEFILHKKQYSLALWR